MNHSAIFINPKTKANTQKLRDYGRQPRNVINVKMEHRQMLDSYMCEFMWKSRIKIHQLDGFELFFTILLNSGNFTTLTYVNIDICKY